MPVDRRYTREELKSLRRGDLQSIFKTNGLVGANQSTNALIDILVAHYESPSWVSPNKRSNNGGSLPARPTQKRTLSDRRAAVAKPVREIKRRPAAIKACEKVTPVKQISTDIRSRDIVLDSTEAGPSTISPSVMPPPSMPASASRAVSTSRMKEMLDERDRIWELRMESSIKTLEQSFERRLRELELRVEEKLQQLTISTLSTAASGQAMVPGLTLTADTPTNIILGKRTERSTPTTTQTPGPSSSPATKRARVDTTEEEDDSDALLPHTPSPPHTPSAPHTPSPGHQGIMTDNSRTPGVSGDFFNPPRFAHDKASDDSAVRGLPYPLFATTPRPSEPRSPTLDVPPSANRRMAQAARAVTLTPGRRKPSPAPRAVSEAHKELTTITESDEPPFSIARRRVASENTPTRLVPASMRGSSVPVSPPQLSPSPSIGATEREGGFSYTPFPPVPRLAKPHSGLSRVNPIAPSTSSPHDPAPPREERDRDVSPLDSYMDIARDGLFGPADSPGQMVATPSHRTLLGTERYRDTRFGDVPVFNWGSPSVDLGPNTPASRSQW